MIDLASLNTRAACDKAVEFELEHPGTGEKLGEFISLVGIDSAIAQKNTIDQDNERRRKASLSLKMGKDIKLNSVEQDIADTVDKLVACTVGFRSDKNSTDEGGNFLHFNGKLEFTPDNARALYSNNDYPWIRRFLVKQYENITNFMPG